MAHYVVIGLGGSGLSAVNFLVANHHQVSVTDAHPNPPLAAKLPSGVKTSFGAIDGQMLLQAERIVISPGIDPQIAAVADAKQAGVEVISDVYLFIETLRARDKENCQHTPVVAITGSNAKSTVTTLVGEMANHAGFMTGVGGNIGTPALDLLAINHMNMVVLELSSFQLEHISNLGADVATILNLSADHLDRHGDMAGYLAQKLRIFDDAKAAVINIDDVVLAQECQQSLVQTANVTTTSGQVGAMADFYLEKMGEVIYLCHQGKQLLNANELMIKGKHNLLNALSALALGQAVNLPMDKMLDTLRAFKGLPHRCEFIAQVDGRAYFNDSKGTNIGSTIAAIDGLGVVYGEHSLALIVGGQGKGQDFAELAVIADKFTDKIYLIGEDAAKIEQDLLSVVAIQERLIHANTLAVAVELASQSQAKAVLLSPACASFDQFQGYADRGEQFVALVQALSS